MGADIQATPSSSSVAAMALATLASAFRRVPSPRRSAMTRQTLVFERVAGSLARWPPRAFARDPGRQRRRIGVRRPNRPSSPPIDSPVERIEIILDAEQRRRIDGLALEDRLVELAGFGEPEELRRGQGGV